MNGKGGSGASVAAAALAFAVCSAALGASAQSADELIDEGVALREHGRDQEALDRFERAHAMAPTPRALAQIALAEQALGRWVEAEEHLAAALARPDAWVSERLALLEQGLARIRAELGELDLVGGPPGAQVSVEGRAAGQLPLAAPLRVEAGTVGLEVRAEGHLPFRRSVDVSAGRTARVEVRMQRADEVRMHGADAGSAPVAVAGSAGPPPELIVAMSASYGTGVVGLSLFGGLGGIALGEYQAVERACGATASCTEGEVASIGALAAGADATLAIGLLGIAVGTALLLYWLLFEDGADERAAWLMPGGATTIELGRF